MSARPQACCALAALLAAAPALAVPQAPHDTANNVACLDCHVPYASLNDPAVASGAASAGTTTTLTDGSKAWAARAWVDGVVTFTSGANLGQFRPITDSAATTLTWATPLPAVPAAGDTYRIGKTTHQDIETKCKSCHNPTGSASAFVNVGLHTVDDATIGCGKCHEPHNVDPSSGRGNRLIRASVRWPNANNPTVYPSGSGNRHLRGAAGYNGICETCHTQVGHHRNNASGDHAHQTGADCTSCHPHTGGFTVNCLGCHNTAQDDGNGVPAGGRRAVVGEFPVGSAHAHYGATLSNRACRACHNNATHGDGYVDLQDADDANVTYRFLRWRDLSSDPDASTFCLSCHDGDGARRLKAPADPFGNGNRPPDVAERLSGTLRWNEWYGDFCWGNEGTLRPVNSHHDVSTSDQTWSGAKVECLDCHNAHASSDTQKLANPATGAVWTGTNNGFCLACHNGGTAPTAPGFPTGVAGPTVALRGIDSCGYNSGPWWVDYRWQYEAHGQDSKRGWPGYTGAPGAVELDCVVCHDAHGSVSASNPQGNPYMIRDQVDGTPFVDDGVRTSPRYGPPWNTRGVSREVRVPISGVTVTWDGPAGLCSTCHAAWYSASSAHSMGCTGCQTCHGHGQSYGGYDWGGTGADTPCP